MRVKFVQSNFPKRHVQIVNLPCQCTEKPEGKQTGDSANIAPERRVEILNDFRQATELSYKAGESFDKTLQAIAVGGLGLVITLLKDATDSDLVWQLSFSIGLFLLAMILSFYAQYLAQELHSENRDILFDALKTNSEPSFPDRRKQNRFISSWNVCAAVFICIGAGILLFGLGKYQSSLSKHQLKKEINMSDSHIPSSNQPPVAPTITPDQTRTATVSQTSPPPPTSSSNAGQSDAGNKK